MKKETLLQLKNKLEKNKELIKKELKRLAEKDENLKGDWDTRYPHWNGASGSSALEDEADEVEEYSTLLPIEHSLETRLIDIDLALKKIKTGNYGKCENCGKKIPVERLKVFPEARICFSCKKKK